jgi:hypothetical protein
LKLALSTYFGDMNCSSTSPPTVPKLFATTD